MTQRVMGRRLALCTALCAVLFIPNGLHVSHAVVPRGLTVTAAPPVLTPDDSTLVVALVTNSSGATINCLSVTTTGGSISGPGGADTKCLPDPFTINLVPKPGDKGAAAVPCGHIAQSTQNQVTLKISASHNDYAAVPVTFMVGKPAIAEVALPFDTLNLQPANKPTISLGVRYEVLCSGWTVIANPMQRGLLSFVDDSLVAMNHHTQVFLEDAGHIKLANGEIVMDEAPRGSGIQVVTPNHLVLRPFGTRYVARAARGTTTVTDLSGLVLAHNGSSSVMLRPQEQLVVTSSTQTLSPTTILTPTITPPWAAGLQLHVPLTGDTVAYLVQPLGGAPGRLVVSYSLRDQRVLNRLDVASEVRDVAISPDGNTVYLAKANGVYQTVQNLTPPTLVIATARLDATAVAVTPDGQTLAVGDGTGQALDLLNATTGAISSTIALGYSPHAITIDDSGRYAAVTGGNLLSLVDLAAARVLMIRPVIDASGQAIDGTCGRPVFDTDSQLIYVPVPAAGRLLTLSVNGRSWISSVDAKVLGGTPAAVAPAPNGSVYAGLAEGNIVEFNPITGSSSPVYQSSSPIIVRPSQPITAMMPGADGTLAAVTVGNPPMLLTVDPSNNVALSIALGAQVTALAVNRPPRPPDPYPYVTPPARSLSASNVATVETIPITPPAPTASPTLTASPTPSPTPTASPTPSSTPIILF